MRFLEKLLRKKKTSLKVPKSVQDAIPIIKIYSDGIFYIGKNTYSKTYKFNDINYSVADKAEQQRMIGEYGTLLNVFGDGVETKITIVNRKLNKKKIDEILFETRNDKLNEYREEYNKMLIEKVEMSNNIVQEKYITVTIERNNVETARVAFNRITNDISKCLSKLQSKITELDCSERLRLLYDFYRTNEENTFEFDFNATRKKGHSFKDYICPDTFVFKNNYIEVSDRFARVLFLKDYANYMNDSMITELAELNKNMMLSIDFVSAPKDEAINHVDTKLLGIETNISNFMRRQFENQNYITEGPTNLEDQKKEVKSVLKDIEDDDQRLCYGLLTIVHTADSKEELDYDTEVLKTVARNNSCQLSVLKFQQLEGMNTVLPIGHQKICAVRSLTTPSLTSLMPFRVQEINDKDGIYYGENVISKNMIIADRRKLLNGNAFILGVSGSGKSFTAKEEMTSVILREHNSDVIIIDPEAEYTQLVKALGGEVIKISATSDTHINAMDMNKNYDDGKNPIILKSEFILSLCEQLMGNRQLDAKEKSIIDRCTSNVYKNYLKSDYKAKLPTLKDFRQELLKQPEVEAKEIALSMELFTDGSLDTFAKHTNVDTNNRLICYDIHELSGQLQGIGMLVILDSIINRITDNRAKGKSTYIYIDEIYLLFKHHYSAEFLFKLWKRVRKYGACCTGITQNVEDLLQSPTAKAMLANSEFLIMLNQATTDRIELAELLSISDQEISYITNVQAGEGLMKIGAALIPFSNQFPRNTKLYKLMTTKPNDN